MSENGFEIQKSGVRKNRKYLEILMIVLLEKDGESLSQKSVVTLTINISGVS